jgi:hypothetical protein
MLDSSKLPSRFVGKRGLYSANAVGDLSRLLLWKWIVVPKGSCAGKFCTVGVFKFDATSTDGRGLSAWKVRRCTMLLDARGVNGGVARLLEGLRGSEALGANGVSRRALKMSVMDSNSEGASEASREASLPLIPSDRVSYAAIYTAPSITYRVQDRFVNRRLVCCWVQAEWQARGPRRLKDFVAVVYSVR